MYHLFLKRTIDLVCASFILILVTPFCFLLMGMSFLFLGRPVFFRQKRVGKDGKCFWLIKFRSFPHRMHCTSNVTTAEELTPYGRFLRQYSLDELPSFWNVIRGDLSLVGPRPLLPEFFMPAQRHLLKPGMTGLAQIKGRNAIGWRQKFRYDLWYTKHASFSVDAYILWKTIPFIFSAKGTHLPPKEHYFPRVSDDCSRLHVNQENDFLSKRVV